MSPFDNQLADDDLGARDALNDRAEEFIRRIGRSGITGYEKGEAQQFVNELCRVYNLDPLYSVNFEQRARRASTHHFGFIDAFFPGLLLIEMKSVGADLAKAYEQALDYLPSLKNQADQPQYILVSDFENLHLYDVNTPKTPRKFKLADFREHVHDLDFLLGFERIIAERREKANIEAANCLGDLHDAILKTGYGGHDLQTLLVRILFCLFAEDTGLFAQEDAFYNVLQNTNSSGNDLGATLQRLFRRLDTDSSKAVASGPQQRTDGPYAYLLNFPYINGALFSERIADCDFDSASRSALLRCCELDWSEISPDIFGNLFQHIMHWQDETASGKTKKRRDFGAHYTSERNIRRAVEPLFLGELREELLAADGDKKKLTAFVNKLHLLNILDPACGCGNFLVVAYREIRTLEMQALHALKRTQGAGQQFPSCDVHQMHGIEIDPTAVEIATVALWLTDHQMNRKWQEGYKRIPLRKKANIVCANALRIDWNGVIPARQCSYIVGNPPFIGYSFQNREQKEDVARVFNGMKGAGVLDYVAAWYVKALAQMKQNPASKIAFVSTNSITQGEQVAVLWKPLFDAGVHICFAHRTFKWSNEGSGIAAVHCVIVGFGLDKPKRCAIWDYSDDICGEGRLIRAKRISPYLVDAAPVWIEKRRSPLCPVAEMTKGSQPTDGGNLLLSREEKTELLRHEPEAKKWLRPFMGADEFINDIPRWCLWLREATKADIRSMPLVMARVNAVRKMRLASPKEPTRVAARTPHLFAEDRQIDKPYLLIPRVSSENRAFTPVGYMRQGVIASDAVFMLPHATFYHFGLLCSTMHHAWMRAVCGRLESRYRYSNTLVYNNFPWPDQSRKAHAKAIERAARNVLEARATHKGKSLAWLYNPGTMPGNLRDAHDELDHAVDSAYSYSGSDDDAARVAFLFDRYQALIADLLANVAKRQRK